MAKIFNRLERQLCDIQGRLFERSLTKDLDSVDFISKFMNSKTCEFLDLPYDRLQWAGEEYILEELLDETSVKLAGEKYNNDVLYWTGYVYRYWHLFIGESGREIYYQANAGRMNNCYPGFHTLDVIMVIENLKEINIQDG